MNKTSRDKAVILFSMLDHIWIKDELACQLFIVKCEKADNNGNAYDDIRDHSFFFFRATPGSIRFIMAPEIFLAVLLLNTRVLKKICVLYRKPGTTYALLPNPSNAAFTTGA